METNNFSFRNVSLYKNVDFSFKTLLKFITKNIHLPSCSVGFCLVLIPKREKSKCLEALNIVPSHYFVVFYINLERVHSTPHTICEMTAYVEGNL